ncbi:hypothetical protein B0A48_13350 [Cryoendolithus antarcticus]|uniref:Zn(2)-C6 fungal-type domain-containing protein n=1 Tax=Cryoendolithus antarcticus TaxID=1507870 RepID=A0A1V8SPM1_9PEZI|nr:hypothetical protein B0A48_13350 [Cryoendolithus antarcticus]
MSSRLQDQRDARARRKHHKVLTGCVTCKKRRVKCDETKPACDRCVKAKVVCGGYHVPKALIFESSRSKSTSEDELVSSQQLTVPLRRNDPFASPNPGPAYYDALFAAFLTTWIPDGLLRRYTSPDASGDLVPMSSWAFSAWNLASRRHESVVGQSLVCLTLVTLGTQMGDKTVLADATRQYDLVLQRLRTQLSLLARRQRRAERNQQIAELTAASYVCSQMEYVLREWKASDLHLQGMESLWHACDQSCLEDVNLRLVFHDYCLLWISCSVIHRKHSFEIPTAWCAGASEAPTTPAASIIMKRLAVAQQLPALLEEYDNSLPSCPITEQVDLLRRLLRVIEDIGTMNLFCNHSVDPGKRICPALPKSCTTVRASLPCLNSRILSCYAYGYALQASMTVWDLVRRLESNATIAMTELPISERKIATNCEELLAETCLSICQLTDQGFGLFTTSPCLFALDTAWTAHTVLAKYRGFDLDEVRPWFLELGTKLAGVGYPPLREPWRVE